MTVQDIYEQFRIPPNLQEHQLRVAALVKILTDHWQGEKLPSDDMVIAALFHDMGNIIKFDLSKPELLGPERKRVNYWLKVQKEVVKKYGNNIHQATITICQEAGLSSKIINLIASLEWSELPKHIKTQNFSSSILIYADMRIGPFGILSLKNRMDNFISRYKIIAPEKLIRANQQCEEILASKVSIDINNISNQNLNGHFPTLRQLII